MHERFRTEHDEATPELRAVLEARAARLSQVEEADSTEASSWLAEFRVGDVQYAVELGLLRACLPLRTVTPLPLAPPHVIGLLLFQGQVLTAVSLATILGIRGWREDPAVLLVLEVGAGQLIAVDSEQIPRPRTLPTRLLDDARARSSGALLELTTPELRRLNVIVASELLTRVGPGSRS